MRQSRDPRPQSGATGFRISAVGRCRERSERQWTTARYAPPVGRKAMSERMRGFRQRALRAISANVSEKAKPRPCFQHKLSLSDNTILTLQTFYFKKRGL